jgi:hypothetical protein
MKTFGWASRPENAGSIPVARSREISLATVPHDRPRSATFGHGDCQSAEGVSPSAVASAKAGFPGQRFSTKSPSIVPVDSMHQRETA